MKAIDVIDALSDPFMLRGVPGPARSYNGPEFVAEAVREWIRAVSAQTACIAPGNSSENGFIESFNVRLCDELPSSEIFYSLVETKAVVESWRRRSKTLRADGSLEYKPPALTPDQPSNDNHIGHLGGAGSGRSEFKAFWPISIQRSASRDRSSSPTDKLGWPDLRGFFHIEARNS